MGKITKIKNLRVSQEEERLLIYIDNKPCLRIRKRIAEALRLKEGQDWDCDKLKEEEKFFWKKIYSWEKEKERIDYVIKLLYEWKLPIIICIVGFGANTEDIILDHPKEKGKPDLKIISKINGKTLLFLEVTGTEKPRGEGLWVRWDKILYAKNNPCNEYFIAIVLGEGKDRRIFFVKPDIRKIYKREEVYITKKHKETGRYVTVKEYYVIFNKNDKEVMEKEDFKRYLIEKLNSMNGLK